MNVQTVHTYTYIHTYIHTYTHIEREPIMDTRIRFTQALCVA